MSACVNGPLDPPMQAVAEEKAAAEAAKRAAPVPLAGRLLLLVLALLYVLFAFRIEQVGGAICLGVAACVPLSCGCLAAHALLQLWRPLRAPPPCPPRRLTPLNCTAFICRPSTLQLLPLLPPPPLLPVLQVRAWLGVQQRPEAAGLDGFNLAAAGAFLCYALFVGLTGKKV